MKAIAKKGFRFLAVGAFIGLVTVLLLEVLIRLVWPQQPPQMWLTPHESYGHTGKPNFFQRYPFPGTDFVMEVQTNELGFRDEPVEPETDASITTIVFVGDSFTFGHGVRQEQRFDSLLCSALASKGKNVRCINAGVSAWGTLQQTRYLLDHIDVLSPDIVVLTFCENDPFDDSYFLQRGVSFDRVRFPGKDFLRAHSHLFRVVQYLYLLMLKKRSMEAEGGALSEREGLTTPNAPILPAIAPNIPDELWQRTERYIDEAFTSLRASRADVKLFVQATDPLNADIRRHLISIASEVEGTYVDLAPVASSMPEPERRLTFDGHWSPKMHATSADVLLEQLAKAL